MFNASYGEDVQTYSKPFRIEMKKKEDNSHSVFVHGQLCEIRERSI